MYIVPIKLSKKKCHRPSYILWSIIKYFIKLDFILVAIAFRIFFHFSIYCAHSYILPPFQIIIHFYFFGTSILLCI
jgi:hypothetical protein